MSTEYKLTETKYARLEVIESSSELTLHAYEDEQSLQVSERMDAETAVDVAVRLIQVALYNVADGESLKAYAKRQIDELP